MLVNVPTCSGKVLTRPFRKSGVAERMLATATSLDFRIAGSFGD